MRFEELKPKIQGLTYLDEGWRGVVYRGFFEGKEVAIKVAKAQEKEYAIRKEARILERLKETTLTFQSLSSVERILSCMSLLMVCP
jgi:predicted Ser/Thr protein kinase